MILEICNIVLPIFIIMGVGYYLHAVQMINDEYINQSNRLIFNVALPLLLIYEVGKADFYASFNIHLIAGSILAITIVFIFSYLFARWNQYPPEEQGVFTQ